MFKKIVFFFYLVFSYVAFAETCPSIAEIKAATFHGWTAYDNDEGSPLTPSQLTRFQQTATYFHSIRWLDLAPEGESHCYYLKENGKPTNAFLAKPNLLPDLSSSSWYQVGLEPTCKASIDACRLIPKNQFVS